jgi:hypothetical protein
VGRLRRDHPRHDRRAHHQLYDVLLGRIVLHDVYPMKIEIEVNAHEFDRRGLTIVIPRTALLAWIKAAFEMDPLPIPEKVKPMHAMTFADLHFSRRTIRCLEAAQIRTVEQLTRLMESDLLKLEGLGKVSLWEIKAALKKDGLRLGMRG